MSIMDLAIFFQAGRYLVVLGGLFPIKRDTNVSITKDESNFLKRLTLGFGADQPDEWNEGHEETEIYQKQSVG